MKYKQEDLKKGVRVKTDNGFSGIVNEVKKYSVIIEHSNSLWEYPNNRVIEIVDEKNTNQDKKTPSHYDNGKSYDVIDFCNDYNLNFNRGSAIKYLARAGKKENEIADLKKAIDFIQREIKYLENENR